MPRRIEPVFREPKRRGSALAECTDEVELANLVAASEAQNRLREVPRGNADSVIEDINRGCLLSAAL